MTDHAISCLTQHRKTLEDSDDELPLEDEEIWETMETKIADEDSVVGLYQISPE